MTRSRPQPRADVVKELRRALRYAQAFILMPSSARTLTHFQSTLNTIHNALGRKVRK